MSYKWWIATVCANVAGDRGRVRKGKGAGVVKEVAAGGAL